MSKHFLFLFLIIITFSSCYNTRYINKSYEIPVHVIEEYKLQSSDYKLQPYDYLYVSVKSTNTEINELYESISSTFSGNNSNNGANFFLTGYLISDSGYVFIPTLGEVMVKGKTIEEARGIIGNKFDEILTDAVVNVRLTSFNVTFLGEVTKTGHIPFYREKVNILEGIGSVGGITNFGNMRKVKIIRHQDSVMQVYEIDLSNKNLISQKNFFLHPNDIVYVPPRRIKDISTFVRDYSTFITLFTSTVTTTLLIIQLTKN
jgi:polysaccharide biosynthesis/export protein